MKDYPSGSQTVGPFYSIGLEYLCTPSIFASEDCERIEVCGQILDADGAPIPDSMLEIWQANAQGNYLADATVSQSSGFARVAPAAGGTFSFTTIKPGAVTYDGDRFQAPHLVVLIFMRGLLRNLVTRMYFPDEPLNTSDPILQLIPEDRRATLVAKRSGELGKLEWNIIMQGAGETVFFQW
jgi:protocatechuate 3,4-dioxygenase alpha subunit